jgi:hypothetical protein
MTPFEHILLPSNAKIAQRFLTRLNCISELLVHNPRFLHLLEEARARVRATGGVPLAEFRRQVETP